MKSRDKLRPVWAGINLDNLAHNFNELKSNSEKALFISVIKADAYGHGIDPLYKTLEEQGTDYFAVATLEEAIELRGKTKLPILLFDAVFSDQWEIIIKYNIIPTIFNYEQAKELNKTAKKNNCFQKVHIKLDSGMNRIGIRCTPNNIPTIQNIYNMPNIEVEGIYTHFATADEACKDFTRKQASRFEDFIKKLETIEVNIPLKHTSNSAAIIDMKEFSYNMVRGGISLYGCYPSPNQYNSVNLKPVLSLHARIVHIHEIDKGEGVSYGQTFVADKKTKIATLPIGYADGYTRLLSNTGNAIIKKSDKKVNVVGAVCMDKIMLDVTGCDVEIGDEIILIGEGKNTSISADEIAEKTYTINYEVVTSIGRRVTRNYIYKNKNIDTINYLLDYKKKE